MNKKKITPINPINQNNKKNIKKNFHHIHKEINTPKFSFFCFIILSLLITNITLDIINQIKSPSFKTKNSSTTIYNTPIQNLINTFIKLHKSQFKFIKKNFL